MTFTEILPFLNEGFAVRRESYCPEFKQISASIDDVTHIKSIPEHVKQLMLNLQVGIDYQDQYIIYDFITGIGTYCVFDGNDINAEDWEIVNSDYNPYN